MKIRGRKPALGCSASLSSPSPSSSTTSSDSSSITAAASSASSQDSSNSSPHPSSHHRWHGLDLLVKAIHQVTAGSLIGVPYIQRRVTIRRRRRRGLDSAPFLFDELPQRKSSKRVCNSNEREKKTMKKEKKKKKKIQFCIRGLRDLSLLVVKSDCWWLERILARQPRIRLPHLRAKPVANGE